MASGEDDDLQISISYDLNGQDPKEVEKVLKKTLKELAKSGNIDPGCYKILPPETGSANTFEQVLSKLEFQIDQAEEWELELTTGAQGIACPVIVQICGVKGDEKPAVLKKNADGENAFLPNHVDKFLVSISDSIGDVFKLRFGFPDDIPESTWDLKKVKLFHPIDRDTFAEEVNLQIKKTAVLDPWQEIPIIWPDYPKLPVINYQVYTTTSVKSGRMDSEVFIILYGDFGNTGKRQLKKSLNSKVKFQPCQNDRFEVPAVQLGTVRKVWIQNDCLGKNKNWMLEKVVVKESADSNKEWLFKCRRFFDPSKGDRKTDRILELGKEPEPEPDETQPLQPKPPPPPPKEPSPSPPPSPPPPPKKEKKKKEKEPEPEPEPEPPSKPTPRKEKKKEPPPPPREPTPPPPPIKEKKKKKKEPEPEPDEPEPEPPREPTPPPPPKKEKKKKEPTPPPEEEEEPPPPPPPPEKKEKKKKEEPPPPPPKAQPQPKAPNDAWHLWWENRDEQVDYPAVDLSFIMIGERGESDEVELEEVPLSKGESAKYGFQMEPAQMGDLTKVRVRFGDNVKKKTRWELAKMSLKHLRTGVIHIFEFQKPIIKKDTDTATEASTENIPIRTYVCHIYTGSRPGLAGGCRAYIILRGENGDTGKRWIVNPGEGKQVLQKGETMKMEIDSVDLGKVMGIRLGHDVPGKSPSYFLEKVTIRPSHRADLQYVFTYNDENAQNEGEAQAAEEVQQGQQYDPKDWQLSWVNEQNQPHDFLQIAAILFGEKGQSTSYFIDIELRPGESDGYLIKVEQDIGELIKVRMSNGPKVKGKHPWIIRELRLKNLLTGKLYTFQLGGGAGDTGIRKYKIEIYYTPKGMSLVAEVRLNIKIFGDKVISERIQLENKNKDNPTPMDTFELDLPDLGEVNNLRLGHNKKNKQIGFFVSKVVVKPQHLPNKEWIFNIPYKEEEEKEILQSEWLISWMCSEAQQKVLTTVVFVIYGEEGKKTPEISAQTMLRPGQSEEILYIMEKPKQFKPYKVRVGFWEKQYDPIQWSLKIVRIRCMQTRTIYTFTLNGLVLFNDERDGWREIAIDVPPEQRRLPAVTYELQVFTSKEVGVVTDSKIYVMLKGKQGDTGKRKLLRSLNNGFKNFIPGRMDTFRFEAVDLEEIESLILGHNDQGRYPSWHCERIVITDRHGGQVYEFDIEKWFDKLRADKKIEREFPVTRFQRAGLGRKWFVKVKTGDHPRATTKTSLGLIICGTENTSDIILLGKNLGVDGFKPKEVYEFNVEVDLDDIEDVIGELFKIRLGFLDWNQWPCLLVQEVYLEELATGCSYYVDVNEWIWSSPKNDGWREFQVKGPAQNLSVFKYQLAVWTGTEQQANTNSDIYCQVFGTKGDTGKRRLCNSKSHARAFQHGQMDMFDIEAVDLGDIKKIMVMMIAEEAKDNWHALKVSFQQHPFNGEEFQFDCNRWFDSVNHTHIFTPTVRNEGKLYSGPPGEHLAFFMTGKDGATSASIALSVFGEKGKAGPFPLQRAPALGPDGLPIPILPKDRPFQAGAMDFFPFLINEEQIGRILKVRISSDNKGRLPRWLLEKFCVQNLTNPRIDTYHFNVNDWLADDKGDGELTKEFATEHPAETALITIRYKVEIGIGPKTSLAIPHDVDCTIVLQGGTRFNSGVRRLKKNIDGHRMLQPGKINIFYVTAVGVGDITKVIVGHTCPDARFKFHVQNVTVSWDPNNKLTFPCDEIIVKTKPTVAAEVSLYAKK